MFPKEGSRMKRVVLGLMLTAATALAADWTGYVSETKCGAKHNDGSDASVQCVNSCIKGGAKPVLVVDGKVVNIANPAKVPEALYGKKVKVKGKKEKDGSVAIGSIEAAT
jgi:hypothetical protein